LQLGHVLKLRGRIDEAKAAYLRALALDPAFAAARDELRALGWEEGDGTELQAALAPLDGVAVPRRRRPSLIEQADAARDAAVALAFSARTSPR
jgi:tetratricopeptide (TPR) repeat protein